LRWRVILPPPQVREHAEKLPHMPTVQSTGHETLLQPDLTSVIFGQGVPPCCAGVSRVRLRTCCPPSGLPQLFEHADQLPQPPTVQFTSTGQETLAQTWVWFRTGHASFVVVGSAEERASADTTVIFLSLACKPPPHDIVQVDQLPHVVTLQGTGGRQSSFLHREQLVPSGM
jgi:hypothetical protein